MRAKPFEARATMVRLLLTQSDGCIEWPHSVTSSGYGNIKVAGQQANAHVVACEHFHGPRPQGMEVAHSCGNRRCVNRAHLRWATPIENAADKKLHGTSTAGERNTFARLTMAQVNEIRSRSEVPQLVLAREFGVSQPTVSRIRNCNTWRAS